MKILIINGPNLNFLGIREPEIYGTFTYQELVKDVVNYGKEKDVTIVCYQSNSEGKIIDRLQDAYHASFDGIIINAGAYTHYSYAIRDAIKSINISTVEVHLSDINEREEFRKTSVLRDVCVNNFFGEGIKSYYKAIDYLINNK